MSPAGSNRSIKGTIQAVTTHYKLLRHWSLIRPSYLYIFSLIGKTRHSSQYFVTRRCIFGNLNDFFFTEHTQGYEARLSFEISFTFHFFCYNLIFRILYYKTLYIIVIIILYYKTVSKKLKCKCNKDHSVKNHSNFQ